VLNQARKRTKVLKLPDGVSDADWKNLLEARKAAATDPAVVAAQAELDTAKKGTDEKAIAEAQSKLAEAQKAAVVKAHPELADAANKAAEADKKHAGKSKGHDAGAGKPTNKQ
jgi:2-oxo-4-hydroxy-4-carboxy--5-ureidoimidazoline (OHCU) decarboxylase